MKKLLTRYKTQFCFLTLPALLLLSCASPQAVATFASSAEKTMDGGPGLFTDIYGSCVRRHLAMEPLKPIFFPVGPKAVSTGATPEPPACAAFLRQGEALAKASNLVSAYFRSVQQLASFNSTTVSGPGAQAASNVAVASGLNLTQVDSATKLAGLITQAFTERYREGNLKRILTEADPRINALTQAFADVIGKDYAGLLKEEQQTLAAQYQEVGDRKDPATILLLNRSFGEENSRLNERKAAAQAYVEALAQIREGHHTLATNAKKLTTKDLEAALQNYSDKLTSLLPLIEKHI
jgi:hypothetical protein